MLNTSDLIPVGLTGNVTIQQKSAQFTKTIVADGTFEGTEKFVAKLRKGSITGEVVASTGVVTIFDTSVSSPLPTYSLAANKTTVDEGSTVNIVLTTTNVSAGTLIPYTITGINSADIGGSPLVGNFTVSGTGTAALTLSITADNLTEGFETLTLKLNDISPETSVSIVINDTSESPALAPTYSLSTNVNAIDEGGSVTFTLVTTNVLRGTQVPYTITGVSSADIGAPLTGNFTIGATGTAVLSISAVNDLATEGAETLTVTLDNITPTVSQSVTIRDTSISPSLPTYFLSASSVSVNEGSSVTITLTTTNVANGTSVPYTITGRNITPADFGGAFLTGSFTITNGSASLILNIAADATEEGPEVFTITLDNITPTISAIVSINDTSKTPLQAGYALATSSPKINEGGSVTITLTTTNVAAGTLVPYTISGISSEDIGGQPLSGNFNVSASGIAQTSLTLTATADLLTEGPETMVLTLTSVSPTVSVSVQIDDTSKSPGPSYALSYSIPGYNSAIVNTPQKITINGYYRQFLGRNADPTGLTAWDNNVTTGAMTLSQVSAAIRSSAEAGAWDGNPLAIENSDVVVIKLTTNNVAVGTQVPYTITGINGADISNAPLTGSFTVGGNGEATLSLTTSEDRLTENTEIVTLTLDNVSPTVSTSFRIFDTSTSPTYTLSSNVDSTGEGASVTITLTSTNTPNGTVVPYTVSGTGINATDLTSAGLTWNAGANRFDGSFTINNNTASVVVNVVADATTEGAETFNLTLSAITPTVTKSITINDSSITQTGTGALSVPGLSGTLATLPAEATWVAFRLVGAGGSGGGTDGGGSAGLGFSPVTDRFWTSELNASAVVGPGNPFSFTAPFYAPTTGGYSYIFATDNSGYFTINGGQQYTSSSFSSNTTGSIQLTAGAHTLFVSCTNVAGNFGVGLQIFGPDGKRIFTTRQVSAAGGGSGGAGNYIEGIVQLPATSGPKTLMGGVGAPGKGGAIASGAGAVSEAGGTGFGLATVVSGAISTSGGNGGRGGKPGSSGFSGPGGAGGGASNLYYVLGQSANLTGLVARIQMSNIATDVSPNPLPLTIGPGITFANIPGTSIPAALFNGSGYISAADTAKLQLVSNPSSNFTIEAWVYRTGAGTDPTWGGIIVNKDSEYEVAVMSNSKVITAFDWGVGADTGLPGGGWLGTAGSGADSSTALVPLNTPTHVAVVVAGTEQRIYINGALAYVRSGLDRAVRQDGRSFCIGGRPGNIQMFQGYIGEVRLFNVARSATDIAAAYNVTSVAASTSVVNIAVAGGGGGGGGKANHQSGAPHANLATGLNLNSTSFDGQDWSGDGAGGGGGGGYGGLGGRGAPDGGALASGGSWGNNYKNAGLTWNTWNEYVEKIPATVLPGTRVPNTRLTGPYAFGLSGSGVLTDGSWTTNAAISGVQGGIAVYWTTSLTPPSLSLIPQFADASASVTVSLPPTQESTSGVTFYGDGTCTIGGTVLTWIQGASLPGIGEWYEIKYVSSAPSNGVVKGTYNSTVPENTWFIPEGNGSKGYPVTADFNSMDVTVTVRRRTTGAVVGTVVYKNLGPGVPIYSGGDGYY